MGFGFLKFFLVVVVGGVNLFKVLFGFFLDVVFCLMGGILLEIVL